MRCPIFEADVLEGFDQTVQTVPPYVGSREFIKEAGIILSQKFGTVILDEAHKARANGGFGEKAAQPNNLLCFMQQMGRRTRHMILGTATPIQTDVRDLWDLLDVLNYGTDFVLGDSQSAWKNHEQGIPMATGKIRVTSEEQAWIWLNNPSCHLRKMPV